MSLTLSKQLLHLYIEDVISYHTTDDQGFNRMVSGSQEKLGSLELWLLYIERNIRLLREYGESSESYREWLDWAQDNNWQLWCPIDLIVG